MVTRINKGLVIFDMMLKLGAYITVICIVDVYGSVRANIFFIHLSTCGKNEGIMYALISFWK